MSKFKKPCVVCGRAATPGRKTCKACLTTPLKEKPDAFLKRMNQEARCRAIAEKLNAMMPPDTGFVLFLMDHGDDGSTSYVSTIQRNTARLAIEEWLAQTQ